MISNISEDLLLEEGVLTPALNVCCYVIPKDFQFVFSTNDVVVIALLPQFTLVWRPSGLSNSNAIPSMCRVFYSADNVTQVIGERFVFQANCQAHDHMEMVGHDNLRIDSDC